MCVRILRVDDKTSCLEFVKLSGDQFRFHEHFLDFQNTTLHSMNDTILA